MMHVVSAIVLALCSMWLFCEPAFADRRIALVIGNSAYETVPPLANPANDATAMAEMFRHAGFEAVDLKINLKATEMRRALRDFSDDARNADFAIVYFAGHGIEIQGTNYLIPIDAVLERDIDAFDEAIPLDRLLSVIEPARQLRLVILDACRDNPFAKTMKHAVASRAVERGLAKVEPMSPNTLIAYAAKAGSTAADGTSNNSPFTSALVKYLPTPGLDLRMAFGFVRDDVMKVTRNRQEPFIYGSLGGNDVALVPKPPEPIVDTSTAARDDYDLASQINVIAAWESFIKKYPAGFYSDLARAQRDKLIAVRNATSEQARLAAEKKSLDDARTADAERARIAAQTKAAEDARMAAEKTRAEEAAKAQAREVAERQKAAIQAKAAEDARLAAERKAAEEARRTAERKAAEQARIAAERKAVEDARLAAEKKTAEEARLAAEKKAAEDARLAAEKKVAEDARLAADKKAAEDARLASVRKAAEEAKAAEAKATEVKATEAARAKAAQAQVEANIKLAAVLPGDTKLSQQAAKQASPGCASTSAQTVSLSLDDAKALSLPEECGLKPKDAFKECPNCPEMVVVAAGEFVMGSRKDDIDNGLAAANEAPQHKVAVKESIAVGRFEVTRDQYAAFVDATGYKGSGRCFTFEQNLPKERENRSFLMPGYAQEGNHPAVCVSWNDAQAYADWLARTTGRSYRLPSEAEYEYAARAGGNARFAFTDDPADLCRYANGADQSAKTAGLPEDAAYMACRDGYAFTAPVGSFAANAFGLHDLIGNVWEWTADCFADDYTSAGADSAARLLPNCQARTVRGGDWFSTASSLRPAVRAKAGPDAHHDDIGFRVVRTLAH
jgi:formylglycine-generating enzyme required for sulfatase activity